MQFVTCCFSIDASTVDRLGKYINDSPRRLVNCSPKVVVIGNQPRIIFFATKHIVSGTELRYDYGGGSLPWRKVSLLIFMRVMPSIEHIYAMLKLVVGIGVRMEMRVVGLVGNGYKYLSPYSSLFFLCSSAAMFIYLRMQLT